MKKMIHSSKNHWGLALGEVFIILGAVIIGEYSLKVLGITVFSLFVALPAIFVGLVIRSYFNTSARKKK